jgi:parallel beta-helix repeat protein
MVLVSILGVLIVPSINTAQGTEYGDFHITSNLTWDIGGSPYWIEGNVTVDPGYTLTIDPGVEVLFNGSYSIYVEGTLYAVGDESNLINFTTNVPSFDDDDRFNIQINATGETTIKYANISYAYYGINISYAFNNTIQHNIFTKNFGAILVERSLNNTISYNKIIDNVETGILIRESYDTEIKSNNITENFKGMNIYKSSNITIISNDVFNNFNQGILVYLSNANFIKYNHIFDNLGNGIEVSQSDINDFYSNNISNNGNTPNEYGITVDTNSQFNLIYHNTIMFNSNSSYDGTNKNNSWENGYPLGGNYWSDYNGSDEKRGINQDIPGSDGIGDTPYIIDSDSQDRFPLMSPMRNIAPFLIALISPANESVINPQTIIDLDILVQSFNMVNYTLNGGANVTISEPFDIIAESPNWTEGQNRLNVSVIDASLNVNSSWFVFTFDSLAPNISLASPSNNSLIKAGDIINISIAEPNMNFATYQLINETSHNLLFPYDIDTIDWLDGNYSVTIYAEDLSGTNSSRSYNFTVDSTPPAIQFRYPGNNSYLKPGTDMEFLIDDDHLSSVSYSIEGGPFQSFINNFTIDTTSFADGFITITVTAEDNIGNNVTSIFGVNLDSTAPQIILNSPQNNSVIRLGDPLNFSVIDANPVTFTYSFNFGSVFSEMAPYIIDTSELNNADYILTINVSDYSGNYMSAWFNFSIDSQKPTIFLQDIENNSKIMGGTDLVFYIFEPNLAFANYSVNGGDFESFPPSNTIDTTAWPDGTYTIEVFVIDKTGNFIEDFYIISIDSTVPKVVSSTPKNGEDKVALDRSIRITFSEQMEDGYLLFALSISPMINYTPLMTQDNLTLIIKPDSDLMNLTEYTIIINSSATDLAGNSLANDFVLTFTTGTGEEDDSLDLTLPLLLILIAVILIIVIVILLKRKGKPDEKKPSKESQEKEIPEDDEFDLKDDSASNKIDEELVEEGLGEDEDLVEEGAGEVEKSVDEDLQDEEDTIDK